MSAKKSKPSDLGIIGENAVEVYHVGIGDNSSEFEDVTFIVRNCDSEAKAKKRVAAFINALIEAHAK